MTDPCDILVTLRVVNLSTGSSEQVGRTDPTWIRVQLAPEDHAHLKSKARDEGRGLIEYAIAVLSDAATGNFAIGEPSGPTRSTKALKPSELGLTEYIEGGQDLILLGTTLRSLEDFFEELERAAERGMKQTFVLMDEGVFKDTSDPVLWQLAVRHGNPPDEVLNQLRKSTDRLERHAARFPEAVSVVKLRIMPTFGLTVVDPFKATARMRVSFYLKRRASECNPALHIKPSTGESRNAFNYFLEHYQSLVVTAAAHKG